MATEQEKLWTVIRHPGRGAASPRIAYRGREKGAQSYFGRMSKDIKFGSVQMLDHAGGLQGFKWGSKNDRS